MSSTLVRLVAMLFVAGAAMRTEGADHLCGLYLTESMKIVCNYRFQEMGKRSGQIDCENTHQYSNKIVLRHANRFQQ